MTAISAVVMGNQSDEVLWRPPEHVATLLRTEAIFPTDVGIGRHDLPLLQTYAADGIEHGMLCLVYGHGGILSATLRLLLRDKYRLHIALDQV